MTIVINPSTLLQRACGSPSGLQYCVPCLYTKLFFSSLCFFRGKDHPPPPCFLYLKKQRFWAGAKILWKFHSSRTNILVLGFLLEVEGPTAPSFYLDWPIEVKIFYCSFLVVLYFLHNFYRTNLESKYPLLREYDLFLKKICFWCNLRRHFFLFINFLM